MKTIADTTAHNRDTARLVETRYSSPLGIYLVVSSAAGLAYLAPVEQPRPGRVEAAQPGASEINLATARELDEYFAGRRRQFTAPLDLQGTPFQQRVWTQLLRIGYGETCSYGELAAAIGRPGAARAVGGAVGSNPISILVPCHRVIGANGGLTGYGGGLARKRALLALERKFRGE